MRALLVVAHPGADSYTAALGAAAADALRGAGHTVTVLDLYALGFRAAMSADERRAYETDRPILDPIVAEHAELVKAAELLVFVYPTWWSGLPAILKGWLDRVLVPGVGFVLDERNRARPALTHVRRIVGISTYGSPRTYVRFVNDNGRRTLTRALRMSCSWRTHTTWLGLYRLDTTTAADRATFLAEVRSKLGALR